MTAPQHTLVTAPYGKSGLLLACWGLATVSGLAAIPLVLAADLSPLLLPFLPLAAVVGLVFLWDTRLGLYLSAFSIGPLNILQVEFLEVTVNFPEALIAALFLKELTAFLCRGEKPRPFLPWRSLALYVATAFVAVLTGVLNGNGHIKVFQDFRQFTEYIILYLLVLHRVSGRRQIVGLLACFATGFALLGLHGILQHYSASGIPGVQQISDLVQFGSFRSGSFYGSTPLGAMMVMCAGVTIGLILSTRDRFVQFLLCGVAGMCVVAAVFTQTRASWLAMAVMIAFVFLAIRKTPLVLGVLLCGVVVFAVTLGGGVVERMSQMRVTKAERSLYQRVNYYRAAWYIFREYPLRGLGWGCYYNIKTIVRNQRYVPRERPTPKAVATVHSAYLQILVKGGLLMLGSLGLYLFTWFSWVVREWRARPRDELDHNLFVGTAAALLGYLFHSTFENFFQWPVMSQGFWLLLALSTLMAAALVRHGRIDEPSASAAPETAGA
ncbi:MAG: O-antigen ligase family protein [Candidatus Hydrogenedentes bacterium]|nr:O-antigen ligase family protein [Candidatus Hydrogenedentota bacterium]